MSHNIRTVPQGGSARRQFGRVVFAAALVLAAACSGGTDAVSPLASGPLSAAQATSLATPAPSVAVSGSTVTVSWPAVPNAIEYQVVVSSVLSSEKTTATSVVYTNVPSGAYTAKVRATTTRTNNESGWSGDVSFTVAGSGGSTPAVDNTPPVITYVVDGDEGNNGWYTSDVTVTWTVVDNESAVTSAPCAVGTVTSETSGTTFSCSATSAGGTATSSVTVKLDETVPSVGFSGITSYTVDQSVSITCTASDAMSDLASTTCANVSGAAYSFIIGSNPLSATAEDNAGWTNSASTSFTVSVTSGSLCNLTKLFVSHAGIANSLCVKLNAAAAAAARGNLQAQAGPLGAYVKELQAQSGKAITAANAAILISLVPYL